ncbi:killer cell lectin-like receptor subfamily B member 1 isoform X3 [Hemicordylus capensis]|uniref:killer cell lectin-like receptor subfamily B member 1 isoform X3 n=1 Tax=Hemicordylus capensis TaxID=884348 RepID=UPI00230354A3|nr:killer cell lectin-like receptor subfamily B member 1 isoform X3 [Hemicordylus capensis]
MRRTPAAAIGGMLCWGWIGQSARGFGKKVHLSQAEFLGVVNWWQLSVFVLLATMLILFIILMSLVSAYMEKAHSISALVPQLQAQEQRLKEAVRKEARGKTLNCKACKSNWVQRADACYLPTTEVMSWEDCIAHCKKHSASLLIGSTHGEMIFLLLETNKWTTMKYRRRVPGNYWIGLKYNLTQKIWHWADGEFLHLMLTSISVKETVPAEDICVLLSNGEAVTSHCAYINHCLCKKVV